MMKKIDWKKEKPGFVEYHEQALIDIANERVKPIERLSDLTPVEFVELFGGHPAYINTKNISHANYFVGMMGYAHMKDNGFQEEFGKYIRGETDDTNKDIGVKLQELYEKYGYEDDVFSVVTEEMANDVILEIIKRYAKREN